MHEVVVEPARVAEQLAERDVLGVRVVGQPVGQRVVQRRMPSSWSCMIAAATKVLVIEPMTNVVSGVTAVFRVEVRQTRGAVPVQPSGKSDRGRWPGIAVLLELFLREPGRAAVRELGERPAGSDGGGAVVAGAVVESGGIGPLVAVGRPLVASGRRHLRGDRRSRRRASRCADGAEQAATSATRSHVSVRRELKSSVPRSGGDGPHGTLTFGCPSNR